MKTEIVMSELGYFTESKAKALIGLLESSTYMRFHISYSNNAGNCLLIVSTNYEDWPQNIRSFFISHAFHALATLGMAYEACEKDLERLYAAGANK